MRLPRFLPAAVDRRLRIWPTVLTNRVLEKPGMNAVPRWFKVMAVLALLWNVLGCVATIPLKAKLYPFVHAASPVSSALQVVNVVKRRADGQLADQR